MIKTAQRLGFTLDEVAELLEAGTHRHRRPDAGLRSRARSKLAEVEAKISDLRVIADALRQALEAGCDDLVACAAEEDCPLPFAGLAAGPSGAGPPHPAPPGEKGHTADTDRASRGRLPGERWKAVRRGQNGEDRSRRRCTCDSAFSDRSSSATTARPCLWAPRRTAPCWPSCWCTPTTWSAWTSSSTNSGRTGRLRRHGRWCAVTSPGSGGRCGPARRGRRRPSGSSPGSRATA
ncbi:MerR family DNA-binding protein [Actinomadura madurae]|nr:MerR family DNA-binding protein [Actinomadura madurae]